MDLVEEVIEEILSRLPVKSLLRFRCVSKSWLSLISSDRFHKTHHQNSTKNRAVIFKGQGVLNQCFVHQFLNEASSIKHCPIYDPTNNDLMEGYFAVVGCCNGLLCIINERGFHLWNPATMVSMGLPELELGHAGHTDFGFGWDRKSGACKVFVLNIHPKISEIHVYSSNTNSWKKTIDRGHLGESDAMGVFACGRIHWLTISGEQSIQSLDVASEEFGRIELPFNPPKFHLRTLAEIGGCLHLLCVHDDDDADADADDQQSLAVVWVMKEESGWLKLVTLSLAFELRYLPIHPLFGEGPNGEILIIFRDNFLVYYPTDDDAHEVRAGKMIIEFYSGHFYVETLVWPNFTTATSIAR